MSLHAFALLLLAVLLILTALGTIDFVSHPSVSTAVRNVSVVLITLATLIGLVWLYQNRQR